MSVIMEKSFIDKSEWGPGPWQNEPDKVQFKDADSGYNCIIRRGPIGAWCGYVGVPEGHPCFGKGYSDVEETFDTSVHGGLTFSDRCSGDEETGICHKSEDGKEVWWLGFDCSHWNDLCPAGWALSRILLEGKENADYRTIDYVKKETENLAMQLKLVETCVRLNGMQNEMQSTH